MKYCRNYDDKKNPISKDKGVEDEFADNIKENIWLSYFLKTTPNLDEDKTWIDFETEILAVIKWMSSGKCLASRSSVGDYSHRETLTRDESENGRYGVFNDYLRKTDEDEMSAVDYAFKSPVINFDGLYKQLRKFTRAFEIYCCSIINEKSGITHRYELNEALLSAPNTQSEQNTYIVSFNYTRTFNRFYDFEKRQSPIKYRYVYPHGEACADISFEPAYEGLITRGLVLGTRSFDRNETDKEYEIPVEFNVFQKHNQQHRFSTLADFQHLLLELRKSAETDEAVNIFVIGHSLDESDYAKLKHLFVENKNAQITIYYHDEASFQRYINNITNILGESDVAVRVRFYHQNNQPNGLLLPFWRFADGRTSCEIIDSAKEQISEILKDYFFSKDLNIHTLATPIAVKSVDVKDINDIEYRVDEINSKISHIITAKGSGRLKAEAPIGDNGDFRHGDGMVSNISFLFEFSISLVVDNETSKPEDEKYTIGDIDYRMTHHHMTATFRKNTKDHTQSISIKDIPKID